MRGNLTALKNWMQSDDPDFVDIVKIDGEVGLARKGGVVQETSWMKIVYQKSTEVPEGFIVQTAFPKFKKNQ